MPKIKDAIKSDCNLALNVFCRYSGKGSSAFSVSSSDTVFFLVSVNINESTRIIIL